MAFSTFQVTAQFQGIVKVPMYIPPYAAAFSALYNSTGLGGGWGFTNSAWPFIRFRNAEAAGGILSVTCGLLSAINLDSIQFNPTLGGNFWGGGGS